jgi:putative tryptophan/tyrosine transport system substrate-binding protein
MRRRDFVKGLAGSATAVSLSRPLVVRAQQAAMPVIGYLSAVGRNDRPNVDDAFRKGLTEAGLVEGQTIAIEYRWADGHYDRLPALAAELVRQHVAVIAAVPFPSARAAKQATSDIPIVFEIGVDPVSTGLVASLSRPGGNVTGIFNLSLGLIAKRIEIMHEVVPNAGSIAVLINRANPNGDMLASEAQGIQAQLGITTQILQASTPDEISAAFATAAELKARALVFGGDPLLNSLPAQIAGLAARHNLPVCGDISDLPRAGGLMSYGSDQVDAYRLAGIYTGRVVKGEKPADLPVQQSTKIEMVINLKTAKALGIEIPLPLLGRADEVIE